jgi:hypothetical protein
LSGLEIGRVIEDESFVIGGSFIDGKGFDDAKVDSGIVHRLKASGPFRTNYIDLIIRSFHGTTLAPAGGEVVKSMTALEMTDPASTGPIICSFGARQIIGCASL